MVLAKQLTMASIRGLQSDRGKKVWASRSSFSSLYNYDMVDIDFTNPLRSSFMTRNSPSSCSLARSPI